MLLFAIISWSLYCYCPLNALLVGVNQPCNKDRDILLVEDPEGNSGAFLRCNGVGVGTIGFWERKICPNRMLFDFVNQQCRADSRRRKSEQQRINIAILNNSCARGEKCIGGTVCDLETLKCLCPYGTTAELETLSCVRPGTFFASYTQLPNQYGQQSIPVQSATPAYFRPNPVVSGVENPQGQYVQQPRTAVFAPLPLPALVAPGSSCANGEKCGGGSVCTHSLKVCLCPGELEDYGGECVMPKLGKNDALVKVGLGAACGRLAECDYDSSCVNGRCQCVPPLMQHEGRCFLRKPILEVGPGELCDNGQVCSRGSVCDAVIPVCVCPPEWDLDGDSCVRVYNRYPSFPAQPKAILQPNPTTPAFSSYSSKQEPTPAPSPYSPPSTHMMQLGGSKQAGVGVPCSVNTDCMIGAYCKANTKPSTCQCLSTHVNVNGRCEKVIYPGQTGCEHDIQCTTAYTGTKCVERECACPEGFKAVEQTCVSDSAYLGTSCGSSPGIDACSTRPICLHSACRCPPPLIQFQKQCINETELHSIKTRFLGKCRSSKDCPLLLTCLRGRCLYTFGMPEDDAALSDKPSTDDRYEISRKATIKSEQGAVRKKREFGETNIDCWPDQYSCADGKGICLDEKCYCIEGFVRKGNRCEEANFSEIHSCEKDGLVTNCSPNEDCIEGKCVCTLPYGCGKTEKMRDTRGLVGKDDRSFCLSDEDCEFSFVCINSFCKCPNGFSEKENSCQRTSGAYKPINSQCKDDDRCIGGSKCANSICACRYGSRNSGGKCIQRPGGSCVDGQICTGGSACELATCRCRSGYRLDKERCVLDAALPGKSCQLGQKCEHGSFCRFGVCMCPAGYRVINDHCAKTESIIAGSSTSIPVENSLLSSGQFSESSTDLCDSYPQGENDLSKESAPGQCCTMNTVCTGGSVCVVNKCICPERTKLVHKQCLSDSEAFSYALQAKAARSSLHWAGSPCRLTLDCPYRTQCIRGLCRCKRGETIVNNLCRKAIHEVLPGGKCDPSNGFDCVGESHCVYGRCVCKMGLISGEQECASKSNKKGAMPGDSCAEGQSCLKGSICISNTCQCRTIEEVGADGACTLAQPYKTQFHTKYSPDEKTQFSSVELQEKKSDEQNSRINQYLTANHMSINVLGEHLLRSLVRNEIPKFESISFPCIDSCQPDKYCSPNDCVCPKGFEKDNDRCVVHNKFDKEFVEKIREMEKLAKERSQLVTGFQNNQNKFGNTTAPSYIDENNISNSKNQLPTFVPNKVLSSVSSIGFPGERCAPEELCLNGAQCRNSLCVCEDGYININGMCQRTSVRLHERCEINEQCTTNAMCSKGQCICKSGFVEALDSCKLTEEYLKPGDDCIGGGICGFSSYCEKISGVCECQNGMTNMDGSCQIAIIRPGGECTTSAQCRIFSYCDNGYCICKNGYQVGEEQCLPSTPHSRPIFPRTDFPNEATYGFERRPMSTFSLENHLDTAGSQDGAPTESDSEDATDEHQSFFVPESMENRQSNLQFPGQIDSTLAMQRPNSFPTFPFQPLLPNGQPRPIHPFLLPQSFVAPMLPGTPPLLQNSISPQFASAGINPHGYMQQLFPVHFPIYASNTVDVSRLAGVGNLKLRKSCKENAGCPPKSKCSRGRCICQKNHIPFNGACVPQKVRAGYKTDQYSRKKNLKIYAFPLQSCGAEEICSENSYCSFLGTVGPLCICPAATTTLGNRCVSVEEKLSFSKVGDICDTDVLCANGAVCISKACTCAPDSYYILDHCVHLSEPGKSCANGEVCIRGSECQRRSGLCSCQRENSTVGGGCGGSGPLHKAEKVLPGLQCDPMTNVCSSNSSCSLQKICECNVGFKQFRNRCIPEQQVRRPGELCDSSSFCDKDSFCFEGVCECLNGHKAINKSCYYLNRKIRKILRSPMVQLNIFLRKGEQGARACEKDLDCAIGKKCISSVCINNEVNTDSLTTDGSVASFPIKMDEACINDHHCPVNFECKNGICLKRLCKLNSECGQNSACVKNHCKCEETSVLINGDCISRHVLSYPGEACDEAKRCIRGSSCFSGFCICGYERYFDHQLNACISQGGRPNEGQHCVSSGQCAKNLYCRNNVCSCDQSNSSCRPRGNEQVTSPPGGSCYNSEECTGGSICRDGWCVCPDPTMIVTRGICIKSQTRQTYPSTILSTAQPYYPPTEAAYKSPTYVPYTPSPTTRISSTRAAYSSRNLISRKAAPGTNCGPLDECVGGSMCVEGACICPAGSSPSPTTARCEANPTPSPTTPGDYTEDYSSSLLTPHLSSVMPPHTRAPYRPPPVETSWTASARSAGRETSAYTKSPTSSWHALTTVANVASIDPYAEYNSIVTAERPKTTPADECAAVGLYCRGGTVCIGMSCQCPPGYILHNDQCVPPSTGTKRRGKSWSQVTRFARPNEPCRNGETCTGGSYCSDKKVENTFDIFNNRKTCLCPAEKPVIRENTCIPSDERPMLRLQEAGPGQQCDAETRCTEQSVCYQGMCRCQAGYAALSGKCVKLPVLPTAKTIAPSSRPISVPPGQPCEDGRICRGGSSCVDRTCRCADNQVIYNDVCVASTTARQTTTSKMSQPASYTTSYTVSRPQSTASISLVSTPRIERGECEDDTQCTDNRICIVRKCKCKSGYVERNGVCVQIEEIDYSDQAIPTPAAFSSQSRSDTPSRKSTSQTQISQTLRPRITGPPLKRPRPRISSGSGSSGSGNKGELKTRSGNGVCPPGNDPAREESSGKIIVCNGMEPNCPPRSYCYVTGYASEEYNCCKSW